MLPHSLDQNPDIPATVRVKDYFRAGILSGRMAPGDRLPSIRDAGRSLGVHHLTVAQAYRRLAADGLVQLRGGVGTFVSSRAGEGELVVCMKRSESADTFAAEVAGAIGGRGRLCGHSVAILTVENEWAAPGLLRSRAERGALRGAWIRDLGGEAVAEATEALSPCGIPMIHLAECPGARYWVSMDQPAGIRMGTRHLLKRGCRRLALLGAGGDRFPERIEAFRATCEALGAECRIASMPYRAEAPIAAFEHHGSRSAAELFNSSARPDGLLIADDCIGRGALTALLRLGVRVPEDVRVCTMSRKGSAYPSVFGMEVARFEVSAAEMADAACRMMERVLAGEAVPRPHMRIVPRFLDERGQAVDGELNPLPTAAERG